MTTFYLHHSASILLVSLMLPLAGCATGGTTSGHSTTGTPPAESRQSAAPERKDKKPQTVGNRKPAQNRTSTDETSGPPIPAKPPAIGGSGG
jgi:hypothetical protein